MFSIITPVICCLMLPADADRKTIFDQSYQQWSDYEKKTENYVCATTTKNTLNDKLTSESQRFSWRNGQGFANVYRATFPPEVSEELSLYSGLRPRITLARNKGKYFEIFNLTTTHKPGEFKDIVLSNLAGQRVWNIQSESTALVDAEAYPGDYPARNTFNIHDGFRFGQGPTTYVELLYSTFVTVSSAKDQGNMYVVTFTNDPVKGDIKRLTGGTLKLLKDQNWLISDCELQYVKSPQGGWTTDKVTVSMKYATVDGVTVPVSREEATYQTGKDDVKRVMKTTTSYTVSKGVDDKLLQLSAYGLEERTLRAPAPPEPVSTQAAAKPYTNGPEPFSSFETIPQWAWFSAVGIAIVVALLLMLMRPRKVAQRSVPGVVK